MGADYGERSEAFTMRQRSYRLDEALGYGVTAIEFQVPRGRQESYFPALLEPRTPS